MSLQKTSLQCIAMGVARNTGAKSSPATKSSITLMANWRNARFTFKCDGMNLDIIFIFIMCASHIRRVCPNIIVDQRGTAARDNIIGKKSLPSIFFLTHHWKASLLRYLSLSPSLLLRQHKKIIIISVFISLLLNTYFCGSPHKVDCCIKQLLTISICISIKIETINSNSISFWWRSLTCFRCTKRLIVVFSHSRDSETSNTWHQKQFIILIPSPQFKIHTNPSAANCCMAVTLQRSNNAPRRIPTNPWYTSGLGTMSAV